MENGKNWGYYSETLKPIVTKFGTGNYVGDMTPYAKIQTDRPANGLNIIVAWFLVFSFLWPQYLLVQRLSRRGDFDAVGMINNLVLIYQVIALLVG